jgi:hypothetical protein
MGKGVKFTFKAVNVFAKRRWKIATVKLGGISQNLPEAGLMLSVLMISPSKVSSR